LTERTLLLGNGPLASGIAKTLLSGNIPVMLATPDTAISVSIDTLVPLFETCTETRVTHCTGSAGNFQVVLSGPHGFTSLPFTSIVIAEDAVHSPLFSSYRLSPCPAVLSLSEIRNLLRESSHTSKKNGQEAAKVHETKPCLQPPAPCPLNTLSAGKTAVFIVGLAAESYPHLLETAMDICLMLRSTGMNTMILTRNLKVGASGMEALYRQTREAGVAYVKFSDALPSFHQEPAGNVCISFVDEITQLPFTIDADLTVVDEAVSPSPYVKDLSRILYLDTDTSGFLQSDNIHRLSVFTNRKGILAAGASRGVLSPSAQQSEIQATAVTLLSLIKGTLTTPGIKAEIRTGACVRCLTCFRLCPYHAIILNAKPFVISDACERCGMCAAECPAKAIRIEDLRTQTISERLKPIPIQGGGAASFPFLVAFCCSRSAGRAKELATASGSNLPQRMTIIEVPCSGAISVEHIMAAFKLQADGVLVFTCHEGNCHSEKGNILAARRTAHLKTVLKQIGIDPNRLVLKTLAANMAAEFVETACAFEKQIADAGPIKN
jgi:coenzyme F420-reducing hydrogenase delta subunit/Pyruvate/2-oxoacid:ferredoxin oxidoreductase delta subunit